MQRLFLLSPAHSGGRRAAMLMRAGASFDLALRVRAGRSTLGDVFSFCSGLYFRGKMAYAQRFARPPSGISGALVITPSRGLVAADAVVGMADLVEFSGVPIDVAEHRFTEPLCASAASLPGDTEVVLLGSIATGKYVDCLLPILGERLLFPAEFVGRGDMSRGGLMLRCSASGDELNYVPVAGALRRGRRAPRIDAMALTHPGSAA